MKLPGTLELSDETIMMDGQKIIHLQVKEHNSLVPAIVELDLIPEINFVKGLLERMCYEFEVPQDQPIIIAGSNVNQLSYVLGLLIGLQNGSISTLSNEEGDAFIYTGVIINASSSDLV